MTVRFGIVGCGRIAERHVQTIAALQGAELVAVSDIMEERMKLMEYLYRRHKSSNSTVKKYKQYREMLFDPKIDVICITTMAGLHAPIAKEALNARRHVVLEKPMSLSLKDADDIINLAESRSLCVLVCHPLRYRPIMQKVKECIDSEALGPIYLGTISLRLQRSKEYYGAAGWRGSWTKDGGMLINQGIHLVDLLQWFLGDTKQVFGSIVKGPLPKETEDAATGLITFQNQARGVIEANTITYPNNMDYSISLFGEKGTISIGGLILNKIIRWNLAGYPFQQTDAVQLIEDTNEHIYMYQDLLDYLNGSRKNVLMNAREGRRSLETIFGLYKSAASNKPITMPLSSFSTASMKGRTG